MGHEAHPGSEGPAMLGVFHDEIAIHTLADQRFEMRERHLVDMDYKMDYASEVLAEAIG